MANGEYPGGSKGRVNRAGDNIRNGTATEEDLRIVDIWRAAHAYILNTFQATLRNRTRGRDIVVAQRLKRKNTIFDKLRREPKMQLARMDDVAGCRLIFPTETELRGFRQEFHGARFKHKLRNEIDKYDYINAPKDSGYRGVHDVYEYNVNSEGGRKYNGLLLELQYRTAVQHAWATSVEVAGAITGNQPKFNEGDENYKEFFRLTSEIIARVCERKMSSRGGLSDGELVDLFHMTEERTGLLRTLKGINAINKEVSDRKIVILVFSADGGLDLFTFDTSADAVRTYFELERESPGKDIVLVRADTGADVRNAFRNYFSDTNEFVRLVEEGCDALIASIRQRRQAEAHVV